MENSYIYILEKDTHQSFPGDLVLFAQIGIEAEEKNEK